MRGNAEAGGPRLDVICRAAGLLLAALQHVYIMSPVATWASFVLASDASSQIINGCHSTGSCVCHNLPGIQTAPMHIISLRGAPARCFAGETAARRTVFRPT